MTVTNNSGGVIVLVVVMIGLTGVGGVGNNDRVARGVGYLFKL